MQIQSASEKKYTAFLELGFRPFFLFACVYAIVAALTWYAVLNQDIPTFYKTVLPGITWHAHEMVFGYALAVVSGFILTAVGNWTGTVVIKGYLLLVAALSWLLARIVLLQDFPLYLAAVFDGFYLLVVAVAITIPVVKTRQWKQAGIVSKIYLMLISNMVFYAGVIMDDAQMVRIGLYSGLYLVIALILVMGRRVIPFFIEKGVSKPVQLKNSVWLDRISLLVFLVFWLLELISPGSAELSITAAVLAVLHMIRLAGWYTHQIWRVPLLWVLLGGYAALIAGFVLKALVYYAGVNPFLALHAFAYGGIGIITAGMMSRVTLGHTGRNVMHPPAFTGLIFLLLVVGFVLRVIVPLAEIADYSMALNLSIYCWVAAFALFLIRFGMMYVLPNAGND